MDVACRGQAEERRRRFVMRHCPNHLRGLEFAPSRAPIAERGTFDVAYVALPAREVPPDIRSEADLEWHDGQTLAECVGGRLFGYAVAVNVFEQMPNPVGWIRDILDCLEPRGRLALLLPHRERSINRYRQDTTFAEIVGWAIENPTIPTPLQVMDFLSQSFDDSGEADPLAPLPDFSAAPRHYTDSQALDFARLSWHHGQRLSVHCTVWTPESFAAAFSRLIGLGMLDARIIGIFGDAAELSNREFLVVLEKTNSIRGRHAN